MTDEDVRTTFEGIVMHSILDCATPKPPQEVASKFYQHPYGGVARDVYVTREGFARFFGISVEGVDDQPINCKILDDMFAGGETLGYKIQNTRNGPIEYRITIINYRYNPWADNCNPYGIERSDSIIWGDYKGPPEDY